MNHKMLLAQYLWLAPALINGIVQHRCAFVSHCHWSINFHSLVSFSNVDDPKGVSGVVAQQEDNYHHLLDQRLEQQRGNLITCSSVNERNDLLPEQTFGHD